jgi:hypothetical protein
MAGDEMNPEPRQSLHMLAGAVWTTVLVWSPLVALPPLSAAQDGRRPAGWNQATHTAQVAPDYARLFARRSAWAPASEAVVDSCAACPQATRLRRGRRAAGRDPRAEADWPV